MTKKYKNGNPPLTSEEEQAIAKLLTRAEIHARAPYRNLNGGFANAEVYDYDENFIDVELCFGRCEDGFKQTHSENLKINRKTLKWEN